MSFKRQLKTSASRLAGVVRDRFGTAVPNSAPSVEGGTRQPKAAKFDPVAVPPKLREIWGERATLHEQIGIAANKGKIADALPLSLLANHEDEATEWRRLLAEEEHGSRVSLRRLDAMFPEPPPPAPEPPAPRPAQHFPRIGNLFGGKVPGTLH